uniref:Putative BTB_POZ domain-containing protein n=1 Tax=Moumouvirus sp. 'Monve' TaxID=1128131 RepID=H2EF76_9VIRU|nr:putative BTB_POZ domain-containing protein [Moumouvirus Monve]
MDVTIITGNEFFQTKYDTIKDVPGFINNLNSNNNIIISIPDKYVKLILNYLRGYEIDESGDVYHYMHLLEIDIQKENHVKINIGGKIFYLDKNFLMSKFEYFERFFKYHNILDPDYSSIVIDRCYDLFKKVINHTQNENEIYLENEPEININLQNEFNFYGKKPAKVIKKLIYYDRVCIIKNPHDNFYYVNNPIDISQYSLNTDEYNVYDVSTIHYNYNDYHNNPWDTKYKYFKFLFKLNNRIKKSEIFNYVKLFKNNHEISYCYKYDKINNLLLIWQQFDVDIIPSFKLHINKTLNINKFYFFKKYFLDEKIIIKNTHYGKIQPIYFKYPITFGSENEPVDILKINIKDLIKSQFFNTKKIITI